MQKSTCYRLIRNPETKKNEYVLTPSYLEIFKDENGNEIKVHIHRIEVAPKIFKWSATEESTALKCTWKDFTTKKECYDFILQLLPNMAKLIKQNEHYVFKLLEFKEGLKHENHLKT